MSALKDIYDVIKDLKKLVDASKNADMAEKLVIIQAKYFDIREEMENLRNENKKLKENIKNLEQVADIENDLELTNSGYYIKKSEKNSGKNIKYCAKCWNVERKLIPYSKTMDKFYTCANCRNNIQI